VSPDGRRLYVANHAEASVAQIDTSNLQVVRTATINFGFGGGAAYAAHDSESGLYLAGGRRVVLVDATELTQITSWLMKDRIGGIQVTGDRARLYVALGHRVAILSPETGERLESLDPPGVRKIVRLGPHMPSVDDTDPVEHGPLTCAC
jgi:YVTN family beta-propeller protein